jgi:hypothetical protein
LQETGADLFPGGKKILDLGAQYIVRRACLVKQPDPLFRIQEHGLV